MSCPTNLIKIKPEWMDHNGHLNVAYFVLAFDFATDAVYEDWGIGLEYQKTTECSVYTLGMNVDYLKEVFAEEEVQVTTQLLACDHRKIHYFHTMLHSGTGEIAATNECLAINVNLQKKKSAPFPQHVQHTLAAVLAEHAKLARPAKCGRHLSIGSPKIEGAS